MIASRRLRLRKIKLDDAPFIMQLVNTPSWISYIGDRHVHDLAAAADFINRWALLRYDELGYGPLLILNNNMPLGVCGLFKRDYLEYPDLGFALMPAYEGNGYAFEACQAVLNYAETIGLLKLYAITSWNNAASQRLLKKLRFEAVHKKNKNELLFERLL